MILSWLNRFWKWVRTALFFRWSAPSKRLVRSWMPVVILRLANAALARGEPHSTVRSRRKIIWKMSTTPFLRIIQIEHIKAVEDLERIIQVEGIDLLMVGPE